MEKELWINRTKLYVVKDAAGKKKFFRALSDGQKREIETCEENLIDVLDSTLWPLALLKDMLGQEESPGPIHHLLANMLETLEFKLDALCNMIEEEFGKSKVYECNDAVPFVPRSTFLDVKGPSCLSKKDD